MTKDALDIHNDSQFVSKSRSGEKVLSQ